MPVSEGENKFFTSVSNHDAAGHIKPGLKEIKTNRDRKERVIVDRKIS